MRSDSTSHWLTGEYGAARYERRSWATVDLQREIVFWGKVERGPATSLVSQRDSVIVVANTMAAREDSVFVVIGTERELAAKGLVRREGGTLLMFGRGKTLVPGRVLDRANFTVLSKQRNLTIALPRDDKDYRVVSRQALEYTDVVKPLDAIVRGAINITDAERFWAPSKYLILVQR